MTQERRVKCLVRRLRAHAEAHEYIANADPEQKQWMNDLYDDAERAAAKWAYLEDAYSNEYLIANGHSMEVCVRAPGSRDVQRFMVHGRLQRVYSANAIS